MGPYTYWKDKALTTIVLAMDGSSSLPDKTSSYTYSQASLTASGSHGSVEWKLFSKLETVTEKLKTISVSKRNCLHVTVNWECRKFGQDICKYLEMEN